MSQGETKFSKVWNNFGLADCRGTHAQRTSLKSIVAIWRRRGANLKKECAMKLNSAQVQRTLGQFEARVIPDNHPVISQLNDLFGEHTFFLDQHGLNIMEPVEAAECAKVVNLASWSDDDSRSGLELHEPAATEIVVTLGSSH
jgi:hypothetical protein